MWFATCRYPKSHRVRSLGAVLAGAALVFSAGCSSNGSAQSTPSTTAVSSPSSTPAPAADASSGDMVEFCSVFQGLSDRRQQQPDGSTRYPDEAAWDRGIKSVEHIVEVAPDEIEPQAATYLQLVTERKGLAATYGYAEVPADAKLTFGRAHAAMQAQANQLIAYAKSNCTGVK